MELEDFEFKGDTFEILKYPSEMLKTKTEAVVSFDSQLSELVNRMVLTMYREPGCGLSANQVGINQRIFVTDTDCTFVSEADSEHPLPVNIKPRVFINPRITSKHGEACFEEGCLSFPGITVPVTRAESLFIEFQGLNGQSLSLSAEGYFADCIQHESDHLDGITFLDRVGPLKRQMLKKKYLKIRKRTR